MANKELTKKQKETMAKHSKHHSAKHMKQMKAEIKRGSSFTAAHKKAMRKVGK